MPGLGFGETMNSGIYVIENKTNGRVYVGQSRNLGARLAKHRRRLNNGNHENQHLQRAWNDYGENAFGFAIVEHCYPDLLNEREQHWMDRYCDNRYNIVPFADGHELSDEHRQNISRSLKGRRVYTITDATRAKMSRAHTGGPGFQGSHSSETKARISAKLAKLTSVQTAIIKERLGNGETVSALAREYKVDRKTIRKYRDKYSWKHSQYSVLER